jgi:hypothetical protein
MALFTFVLDYAGGSYVSQVNATSWEHAPGVWAGKLEVGEVQGIGPESLARLRASVKDETPVELAGLWCVWCFSIQVRGKLALVNYVHTAG